MLELQKQRRTARLERKAKRANMIAKKILEKEGEDGMNQLIGSPSAASTAECVEAFVGSPYPGAGTSQNGGGQPSSGDEIPTSPAMKTSHL